MFNLLVRLNIIQCERHCEGAQRCGCRPWQCHSHTGGTHFCVCLRGRLHDRTTMTMEISTKIHIFCSLTNFEFSSASIVTSENGHQAWRNITSPTDTAKTPFGLLSQARQQVLCSQERNRGWCSTKCVLHLHLTEGSLPVDGTLSRYPFNIHLFVSIMSFRITCVIFNCTKSKITPLLHKECPFAAVQLLNKETKDWVKSMYMQRVC